ncbi:unnamed protein product [Candidula unifasciata]|uniref:DNA-directed RNA polymerase I subunit RPA49 n=1 Tax=Candidula unifasciata TaxID=100452 RepID=A0A8S3ZXB0_9EUPU|nr:unnamed protein product [Candidula unifasciata]
MPVFVANSETRSKRAVAVRFSNGLLNAEDQDRVAFKCYTHKETRSNPALATNHIVTAEVDGMLYVGKNFGPANRFSTENCDYYFGVHNRKTGKIQVISAALCQLEPMINDKQIVDEVDNKSFREKRDALAKDFGSGRNQRAVNKRLNNVLDDDMISATAVSVVDSQHTKDQVTELSETVKSETSAVPPHNKDATTPDEVYKLKDLISSEVLSSMSFKAQVFAGCTRENIVEWREKKEYFSFILDKLETLSLREDARMLQSQYLMYLQYLMKVYLMKSKDLARKFPLPSDWPAAVSKHILETFTREISEPGKRFQRCTPNRLKDLLLSHILVLSLKLSQFCLILDPLMIDLNLSHKRITTHAITLGCTIKKTKGNMDKDVYTAVLTVPLKFPEVKGKRAKNRIF